MKTSFRTRLKLLVVAAATLLIVSSGIVLAAEGYTIPWWTVDNGGGSSQGGQFAVTGTIGQPDTGSMAGGPYTLNGGFWNAAGADVPPLAEYQIYLPLLSR